MTPCDVSVAPTLHTALARRFSPMMFDSTAVVTDEQVDTLLDVSRLAPSAGNSQPWMFVVARRGDLIHDRIVPHLAGSSAEWAPNASLLVVNLAQIYVEDTPDWEYSEFSRYDLGQAVAHMTIQGLAIGLDAHQFRAFDRAGVTREFDVPPHWEVTSISAFGSADPAADVFSASGSRRERRTRDEVTWSRA
ncbi:nitroreductase family protein [Rhodococcus sp. H29-C3]|uniref:nitroreductase family protein n=1 Tax=Rhodococcus sp. H29-C3 TaxID=3046307 RepID=UPI0024BB3DB4|nr:nitroreductase family protein [Rhodococcus sp. H29-C3]MDJ0363206.1 nitroreductase family protein [Rhodococcus sp. H29-C3]